MRNPLYHFWITVSSISLVGKLTFVGTFIITFFLVRQSYAGSLVYFRFVLTVGITFLATFIVEFIYKMIANKSDLG